MTTETSPEEKIHVAVIKNLLLANDSIMGIHNKTAVVIQLFNYMVENTIPFINKTNRFRDVAIQKCYEFKNEEPQMLRLVLACNRLLTALGEPLEKPLEKPSGPRRSARLIAKAAARSELLEKPLENPSGPRRSPRLIAKAARSVR